MSNLFNVIEITDFNAPELDMYARCPEVKLRRFYEPAPGIFLAESRMVIERALAAGYEPVSFLAERQQLCGLDAFGECVRQVPVYTAELSVLTRLTGYQLTRGLLCAMRRRPLPQAGELLAGSRRVVLLENVMNPTNVGAIFRSAAALNMDALLLSAGCSDPLYRRAIRVSMGTVFQIPWTYLEGAAEEGVLPGIRMLHAAGFKTAAMALCDDSVNIDDPALRAEEKLAVILGTEGGGLRGQTIAESDYTVRIPMSHGVDSLNVAAAGAVAFWELGRNSGSESYLS